MTMTMIRHRYPRAAGLVLLAGGILLVSGGMAHAQFKTKAGRQYRIQRTLNLTTPDWLSASDPILATGATSSWSAPAEPGADESYYRVVELD